MTKGVIKEILIKRGIPADKHEVFLNPDYNATKHDPFLLPDMEVAVNRIIQAHDKNELIVIYGDYDVDGMCATVMLVEALTTLGLKIETYTPNRFTEGYGLNEEAIKGIKKTGAKLIITVDCGSTSSKEIELANKLKIDVIVTDHHGLDEKIPPALAVINPHRVDNKYPFKDLAGCGIAFKLVQALQTKLEGFPEGQEKWLLDLVALGTVCDIVPLLDENRNNVFWGINVLKKTRRVGLKALMAVAKIVPSELDTRKIGFVLGPRLNVAGRLETAEMSMELLMTKDSQRALELAEKLDKLNLERRIEQDRIFNEACEIINCHDEPVIVVASDGWNEGVIGIVASKIMEKYHKPTFVLSVSETVKGSGRSFGDLNLADAISSTKEYLLSGGGHTAAAGVSLMPEKINEWHKAINDYYKNMNLKNQERFLTPTEDISMTVTHIDVGLVKELEKLEPFGIGNEKPIFRLNGMRAKYVDRIGSDKNHLKLTLTDGNETIKFLAFSPPDDWFIDQGDKLDVWVNLEINEWQGSQTVEGRILRLEVV